MTAKTIEIRFTGPDVGRFGKSVFTAKCLADTQTGRHCIYCEPRDIVESPDGAAIILLRREEQIELEIREGSSVLQGSKLEDLFYYFRATLSIPACNLCRESWQKIVITKVD